MCGIAGFLSLENEGGDRLHGAIRKMTDTLAHRGPDDAGYWRDEEKGAALGHRRLSILDLSPAGHQPMASRSGRHVIVFNGEIYNFKRIRKELEALRHEFKGHSDTEVLLTAIEEWGLEEALKRSVGMFAFALWDRKTAVLHLVRDRMGKKPLYYGFFGKTFLFGSELKALRAHPAFQGEINRESLSLFLRYNYIPSPHSIYMGVRKLLPGTILTVSLEKWDPEVKPAPYWSFHEAVENARQNSFRGSDEEAVEMLDHLLKDAVKIRMESDVPLGVFLSGGIDSSAIAALMQVQSDRPVRTFTIGFQESGYNEADCAKKIANHLGTDHTEMYVAPAEAMAVIPQLPSIYDEPFSDSSQIPTYLVSKMGRDHVTVSLSGDGGDEVFAGYNRYSFSEKLWWKLRWIPGGVKKGMALGIRNVSPASWDAFFQKAAFFSPHWNRQNGIGDKLHKLSELLFFSDSSELYNHFISHWKNTGQIVQGNGKPFSDSPSRRLGTPDFSFIEKMMYWDTLTYLPDDILVKVDRASMAVSLEVRSPILDHRVVELAWRLPLSFKMRKGKTKWLLRQVLYRYVPQELIERPKMGFGVPIDSWLRGPLREWADSLLNETRLKNEGFFNSGPILQKWKEHLSGDRNWHYYLWDVLMFEAWLEAARRSSPLSCKVTPGGSECAN